MADETDQSMPRIDTYSATTTICDKRLVQTKVPGAQCRQDSCADSVFNRNEDSMTSCQPLGRALLCAHKSRASNHRRHQAFLNQASNDREELNPSSTRDTPSRANNTPSVNHIYRTAEPNTFPPLLKPRRTHHGAHPCKLPQEE